MRERGLEGELLLFFDKNKEGCTLNTSARAIWELCDGRRSVGDILRELSALIDTPGSPLADDVAYALAALVDVHMVHLEPAGSAGE